MKINQWTLVLIGIGIAAFLLVVALPGAKAWQSGSTYSGSGDWTISTDTIVADEPAFTVSGNIYVQSTLTIYNSLLSINSPTDGAYTLNVTSGSTMNLYGSTLSAYSTLYHYKFLVWGSVFINQSTVSQMWGDTASWAGGIQLYGAGSSITNSNIAYGKTGGIYIWNVAATITGNNIYGNGRDSGSSSYNYGIYVSNDGLGTTTSTKIDNNLIYSNYYAMYGYMYYGYGIYSQFQSKTDTITNNRIYDNGYGTGFAYAYGYQLYLQYSNATVTDDFLGNGSYQLYVYGSSPPTFKNLNISSYAYYYWTSYGVYSYNSTLSFSKCTWYDYNGMGTLYGVYSNGPMTYSASQIDFSSCDFNYSMSGSYTRYFIYGNYYTPINVTGTNFYDRYGSTIYMITGNYYCPINITRSTFNITTPSGTGRMVYGNTYSPVNIVNSKFEMTGIYAGGNTYMVYTQTYSPINITASTLDFWYTPWASYVYGPRFYMVYGSSYCPISLNTTNMYMNFTGSGMYPYYPYLYMVYGNSYSNISIAWCNLNMTSATQAYYTYFYMIYANSYTPCNITYSHFNQTLPNTSSSGSYVYMYLAYTYSYSPMYVDNSSFDQRLYNSTSPITSYTFYNYYYYCNLYINDSYVNTSINRFGMSRYSGTTYFMYNYYYGSILANRCKFFVNNCTADAYYGMQTYYGRVALDNSSYIASDNNITNTEYHVQMQSYSSGDFCLTASKFLVLNAMGNYYNNKNLYGMNIYDAGLNVQNSTIVIDFQSPGPWQNWVGTNPDASSPYYSYVYTIYAYSGTARTYQFNNNTVRFYMCNQTAGGYVLYWNGYINAVLENNYINVSFASTGTSTFVSIQNTQVTWRMTNVTVEYQTKAGNYGVGGCMFSVMSNTVLYANDSSFKMRNDAGLFTYNMFRYCGGASLYFSNCTLGYDVGGGTSTELREARPMGWLGYAYGTMNLLRFSNSTFTISVRDVPVMLNVFHFRGPVSNIELDNSSLIFMASAPGSVINLLYFDPAYTASLARFSLKNSNVEMNVNRENVTADAFKITASGGQGLQTMEVMGGQFNISVNVASSTMCSGINMTGIRAASFSDLKINANGPSKIADPAQNTQVAGLLLFTSFPTLTNVTVTGNGLGRTYGILCDVVSLPSISDSKITKCYAGVYARFFSGGTISSTTISDCTIGILVGTTSNLTLVGTTITNAQTGILITDYSWVSLTKCDISKANVSVPISLDLGSTAWSLSSAFAKDKVVFNDKNCTLIINWLLQLKVTWQNDVPIAGSEVVVTDKTGATTLRAISGDGGIVPWFFVTEYIQTNFVVQTFYSPYNVNASMAGFFGEVIVTTDDSKEVQVKIFDTALPVLNVAAPEDNLYQNRTTVSISGTAVDVGSGIGMLSFSYDGANWFQIPASGAWAYTMEVPEGSYTLAVKLSDIAGNEVSQALRINIDLTVPIIEVTSPADNSLGNRIGVDLEGRVEPGSILTVNHRPVAVDMDGTFTYGLRLVEGKNIFVLFARDRAGNTNGTTWTLYLDITPPALVLTAPADGLLTNRSGVTVTGKTEPGAGLTINGVAAELQPDGGFAVQYTLTRGTNIIEVVSRDSAGNAARQTRTVVLDDQISLVVIYPEENLVTNQITILVRGTTDNDVLLRLNGGIIPVASDGTFSATFTLAEGTNELRFGASDRAGNSLGLVRRVVLDTQRPFVEILSPQSGSLLRSREVTVNGSCEPGITLTVNGENVTTESGTFSKTLTLPEGKSLLNIEGRDAAGNRVSLQVTVEVDLTAPSLEIVEPTDGFRTRDLSVTLVGITEPGARVTVNGQPVMVDQFGKFTTSITLEKGANTIKVAASDSAGNSASKSLTVKETTAPAKGPDNSWWWVAAGLIVALGLMLPLTALLMNVLVKRRGGQEGSK